MPRIFDHFCVANIGRQSGQMSILRHLPASVCHKLHEHVDMLVCFTYLDPLVGLWKGEGRLVAQTNCPKIYYGTNSLSQNYDICTKAYVMQFYGDLYQVIVEYGKYPIYCRRANEKNGDNDPSRSIDRPFQHFFIDNWLNCFTNNFFI